MTSRVLKFVSFVAMAVALTSAGAAPLSAQEAGISIGAMAPGAAVVQLDGTAANLADLVGKQPVVLEFWATWCPLCKKLEPQMEAAKKAHEGKITFVSVGVPDNQTAEKQAAYVQKQQLSGTFLFDKDGAAYKAYKATHTSYVVVIDAKGKVVYTGVGGDQDIEAAIAKLGMK